MSESADHYVLLTTADFEDLTVLKGCERAFTLPAVVVTSPCVPTFVHKVWWCFSPEVEEVVSLLVLK